MAARRERMGKIACSLSVGCMHNLTVSGRPIRPRVLTGQTSPSQWPSCVGCLFLSNRRSNILTHTLSRPLSLCLSCRLSLSLSLCLSLSLSPPPFGPATLLHRIKGCNFGGRPELLKSTRYHSQIGAEPFPLLGCLTVNPFPSPWKLGPWTP